LTFDQSRANRAHPAPTVILKRLMDFYLGVHHEGAVARDWFIQRHTPNYQYFQRRARVCRILDSHSVAIGREHDHLSVSTTLALHSEQSCSVNDVSKGVV